MKTRVLIRSFILFCTIISFESCYTTQYVPAQDDWKKTCIGLSKAQIKEQIGIPNRVVNDKELGEILIYEKFSTETTGYSRTKAYADAYAGYGVHANGVTTTNDIYSTTDKRDYIEFYFKEGSDICYNVRTNFTKAITVRDKKSENIIWITLGSFFGGLLIFTPLFLLF